MRIKRLVIRNFKSLREVSIHNPNPFTVFAGSNASGKSNTFEALELFSLLLTQSSSAVIKVFGEYEDLFGRYASDAKDRISFYFETENIELRRDLYDPARDLSPESYPEKPFKDMFPESVVRPDGIRSDSFKSKGRLREQELFDYEIIRDNFLRLFINNSRISRQKYLDNSKLDFYGSNLEKVLKRILLTDSLREELTDILSLWIPGLDRIEVHKDNLTGNDVLHFFESGSAKPFPRGLISDGTINILTLLVTLYQTDQPQFLCIEEPENGLNPKVIMDLVELIRNRVKKTGQHIWLSTHSESLVSALRPEELILVDKKDGCTTIRQFQDMNLHGLSLDKAWLSNVLGGGLPW